MRIFTYILFLTLPGILFAQEDTTYTPEISDEEVTIAPESLYSTRDYKSEKISIRKFDDEKWKSIVGTTNFEEKPIKERKSFQPTIPMSGGILQIISYVVILLIIVAIIYYIIQNTTIDTKKAKKKTVSTDELAAPVEDIEAIDLEALLTQALAEGNLRLVIRAHYLILLHTLHESGNIVWKKNKTNLDYLFELFTKKYYYDEVRKLTLAYETVWYGDLPITPASYEQLVTDFKKISQQVSTPKTV